MLEYLGNNWLWILLIGGMVFMHLGHGSGHGAHGGGTKGHAGCGGGHQHSAKGTGHRHDEEEQSSETASPTAFHDHEAPR